MYSTGNIQPAKARGERHFYMEREWRVLGDVRFSALDVERVVLPREFANRLRSDLPHYNGQVSFSA